ncbi:S41 family peptidase [Pedobacter sp. GSP4]|uniref:S41 family peptidase n=1 Tax=Pedobacter sp. GSP4 TaxID=3453716 RepID=UPI003EED361B
MLRKFIAQNTFLCALVIVVGLAASCKKSNKADVADAAPGASGTRAELTKDSIYLYAQQTYYWNVGMPSYSSFNPRQYSTNNAVLAAIKALPSTGGKDKYSFIDDGSVATQLGGTGGDYGFSANFDEKDSLRVKYVYPASPAATAGLTRGSKIVKVNGKTVVRSDVDYLNNAIFGNNASVTLTVEKGKIETDYLVTRGIYSINPVLYTNTFTVGAKKIGYIVFNSFTSNATDKLDNAFAKFKADGATELIVDLRYNGGGVVETADIFTNLIAPVAQNGKVMYTTYYNKTMQDAQATILENQKLWYTFSDGTRKIISMFDFSYKPTIAAFNQEVFTKRGSLNLNRVYFIVTGNTASASELLINNLKPVMDVKLIGSKTYGKPVGFFSIHIDKSDLYIPQFQTKNSVNYGDYFDGMTVDKSAADDLTKDFGDADERLLSQALYYSANGSFKSYVKENGLGSTSGAAKALTDNANDVLNHEFKGMVETRKLKLK